MYYAGEIEDRDGDERGIHLDSFIGYLLAYVAHARHVYTALGFNGTLQFALRLDHIIQLPFWDPGWDDREASPSSPLDDSVEFQTDSSAEGLRRETEQIAVDLLRVIFSSVNWIESAVDERLSHLLQRAYRYNGWKSLP